MQRLLYWWAYWLMRSQGILLKRIAIAERAEKQCLKAGVIRDGIVQLIDGEWAERAAKWKAQRERHKREFMRLQAKIDACLRH